MTIVTANAVTDPYGRLLLIDEAGFNQSKVTLSSNSRKGKTTALRQCSIDTLVLGTSRVESAIDFEHPAFSGTEPYNAGLRGGTVYEMRRLAEYALSKHDLKAVYLSLDFEAFNTNVTFSEDFAESQLADRVSPDSLASYLFSLQTFGDSVRTLRSNVRGNPRMCVNRGQHIRTYERTPARIAFNFILRRYATGHYGDYAAGDMHFQHLETMLRELTNAGVRVYAFTSPMHVTHLELMAKRDLMNAYNDWRSKLVRVFEAVNKELAPDLQATLWDFSGYNEITTENIPDPEQQEFMRWYDDSSHFNKSVGNMMLERMLAIEPDPSRQAATFGTRLSSKTIDLQIAADQKGSEQYRRDHPDEIVRLQGYAECSADSDRPETGCTQHAKRH